MVNERLIQRLMGIYLSELEEHLADWPQHVLSLEQPGAVERDESLRELYRVVHSLKGASRSVRLPRMVDACHQLETWIGEVQAGSRPLDPSFITLLVSAGKVFTEVRRQLEISRDLEGTSLPAFIDFLDGSTETLPTTSGELPSLSSATPEPPRRVTPGEGRPAVERYLRVASTSLDELLARQSQLSVVVSSFDALQRELEAIVDAAPWRSHQRGELEEFGLHFRGRLRALRQTTHGLRSDVLAARMLPLKQACEGLELVVRDLAAAQGKRARLHLDVGDIELDRAVLESLQDPLRHLVRNAVDHGVENVEERRRLGKAEEARVVIRGELRGGEVAISVEDDGRGLVLGAIAERLESQGSVAPRDHDALAQAIFRPGFSTATELTEVSGRGVGLDVVRDRLARIHGRVDVSSRPGEGCSFSLTVPLTLTVIRVLLVACCDELFALPGTVIERLLRVRREQIVTIEGRAMLVQDDAPPSPLIPLGLCLDLEPRGSDDDWVSVVMLRAGLNRMGFIVERFVSEREVVVMSMGPRVVKVRHVSGATITPTGDVVLILNGSELIETAFDIHERYTPFETPAAPEVRARLLLADDSITARSLLKGVLEAEGYAVVEAFDGLDAWEKLQRHEVDLLVSDVEMPRLTGLELVERVRGSASFAELPAVLVTGLASDEHRARGLEVGANAYLVKSAFDSTELLSIIQQLLR